MGLGNGELKITPALICLLVMNLLDGIISLFLFQVHHAEEVNAIMAYLYYKSPGIFMIGKLGSVSGSILITAFTPEKWKKRIIRFGALVYTAVVIYEIIQIRLYLIR